MYLTLEQPSEPALGRPSFWFCQEVRAHVLILLVMPAAAGLAGVVGVLALVRALCMDSLHPWWTKSGGRRLSYSRLLFLSALSPTDCMPPSPPPPGFIFLAACL